MGRVGLVWLLVPLLMLNFTFANSISYSGDTNCYPGCTIYTSITPSINISNSALITTGSGLGFSNFILINGSYNTFSNGNNISAGQTIQLKTVISNPSRVNSTTTINLSGISYQINTTSDINLNNYYEQTESSAIKSITFRKNGNSITSFSESIGLFDLSLSIELQNLDGNGSITGTLTIEGVNASYVNFNELISISSNHVQILSKAEELNSIPKYLMILNNFNSAFGTYSNYILRLNTENQYYYGYEYTNPNLVQIKNRDGYDKKIIASTNYLDIIQDTLYPLLISYYGDGPVIENVFVSDNTIHSGKEVDFKITVNDSDVDAVYINGEHAINTSRYNWYLNISIYSSPATIYVIDKIGHTSYLDNITFNIENTQPIVRIEKPKDYEVLYNEYTDFKWTNEDEDIEFTKIYIDNGKYREYPGSVLENNKYVYDSNKSGSIILDNLYCGKHKIDLISKDIYENQRHREKYFTVNKLCDTKDFIENTLGINHTKYVKYMTQNISIFDNVTNTTTYEMIEKTFQDYRKDNGINNIIDWNISTDVVNKTIIGDNALINQNITFIVSYNTTIYSTNQETKNNIKLKYKGLDANWKQYFTINDSKPEYENQIKNIMNVDIYDMLFIENLDNYILEDKTYEINLTFDYQLGDKIVLYYESKDQAMPELVEPKQYANSFSINLKKIYGIVIIEKKTDLDITLTNFNSESTLRNSMINITGYTTTLSDNISCGYTITNFKQFSPFKTNGRVNLEGWFKYNLSIDIENLDDDYYKLNITCYDYKYRLMNSKRWYFFVKDNTEPKITIIRNVGEDSVSPYEITDKTAYSLSTPSLTLYTNEISYCAYDTVDRSYYNMTLFDINEDYKHTTDIPLDSQNNTLFIKCIDTNNNPMIAPFVIKYTISDKYIPPTSSIPSVGEGTNFNPLEGTGEDTIQWRKINKNSILQISIDDNTESFELLKMTTNTQLSNVSLSLKVSNESYNFEIPLLYTSMKLNPSNFGNGEISKKIIEFKVKNTWINKHKLKAEHIILKEVDNQGNLADTNTYKLRSTSEHTYFRSEANYLNTYFITTLENINNEGVEEIIYVTEEDENKNDYKYNENKEDITINIKKRSYFLVTSLIFVVSLIISIIMISKNINSVDDDEVTNLKEYRNKLNNIKNEIEDKK